MSLIAAASLVAVAPALASARTEVVAPSPDEVAAVAAAAPDRSSAYAVSTRTATDAWAVGTAWTGHGSRPMIRHWDGTSWTESPGPTPFGRLLGVVALTADNVWAVGYSSRSTLHQDTLIEHWDGSTWSVVPSPNASPRGSAQLTAVSATSATDIWAVGMGQRARSDHYRTLIEHWDGSSWTVVRSPYSPADNNHLQGVSATSPTDAWAVGGSTFISTAGDFSIQPLTLHWDGTTWKQVPCPWGSNSSPPSSGFHAVSALPGNRAWAVGYKVVAVTPDTAELRALTEYWNGTEWKLQGSPRGEQFAVDAVSATDVWAAGRNARIEHFDGSGWSPSRIGGHPPQLNGISASSASNAWAVGAESVKTAQGEVPLYYHWDGTTWTPFQAL